MAKTQLTGKNVKDYSIDLGIDVTGVLARPNVKYSGARVYRSTSQSIANNTLATISYDTVDWDTDGYWSASNPERFTVPWTGYYQVEACSRWSSNASNGRFLEIQITGNITIAETSMQALGNSEQSRLVIVAQHFLNAGDWIRPRVRQASGGSLSHTQGYNVPYSIQFLGV